MQHKNVIRQADSFALRHRRRQLWRRVASILACAVVFCTTYALILPAITMEKPEPGITQQVQPSKPLLSAGAPPLKDDSAYVSGMTVTRITDGTAPFDTDDTAGNDSGTDNKLVRTFDTVTYHFEVTMKAYQETAIYSEARVRLKFVLPLTADQATFDQAAMAWMEAPELTTETRDDGVECQVLTCYKLLLPAAGNPSVVPGSFGENVTVYINSMKNGDIIAPTFSACMEYGTWDGECPTHKQEERVTISPDEVTVSAKPKYNVQIVGRTSYNSTFDFESGNAKAQAYGEGYNKGKVKGRVLCLGVTLQLYNDDASKGVKGLEIPNGSPITFDLELASEYHINDDSAPGDHFQGEKVDVTDTYMPLLWSCDGNRGGALNSDGRAFEENWGGALDAAPYNKYTEGLEDRCCKDGGEWRAVQNGSTVHITVSDYTIDMNAMPTRNADGKVKYDKASGVGCFSAGEVWIVQPYNKIGSSNEEPNFDIINEYGQGTFTTRLQGMNLSAESISGQKVKDEKGTSNAQMRQDDDIYTPSFSLVIPGKIINRVWYTDWDNKEIYWGRDINGKDECFHDGRDAAFTGSKARLVGGFVYYSRNQEENLIRWGTNLLKFNAEAFEIDTTAQPTLTGTNVDEDKNAQMSVLYATKKDGTDWEDDYELQHTYEDDLLFYNDVSAIPSGHKCIGVLFCFKGGMVSNNDLKYIGSIPVKLTNNTALAGSTYMLVSTSRAWTQEMFDKASMSPADIPDWTNPQTRLSDFPSGCYTSGNIEGSTWYRKEEYRPDGSGAVGNHNSQWAEWGDTLLLLSYKTGITKTMLQKWNGEAKKNYALDQEQRVVDFGLQPKIYYNQVSSARLSTTVTIVDTLPKYLTYVVGSSYFGGEYQQTSEYGGEQGIIKGGTLREPDTVVKNPDGTQTLTWVLPNATVGNQMPAIYYSAYIGDRNDPSNDVQENINLTNRVRICSSEDIREPSIVNGNYAEVGLRVLHGNASTYGKYSVQNVVDAGGSVSYVVYYANNGSTEKQNSVLVDAMPINGIGSSKFGGKWEIADFKISLTGSTDITLADLDATLYWTTDNRYAGKTLDFIRKEQGSPAGEWTTVPISGSGSAELVGKTPVMWVLNCSRLPVVSKLQVEYTLRLIPDSGSTIEHSQLANTLSTADGNITTQTPVVNRILEGLTWLDDSADGIQDEKDDRRISGVRVTLFKLKPGGNPAQESDYAPYHYQDNSDLPLVEIQTGQIVSVQAFDSNAAGSYEQGRYKFTDLPAGTFAVRFEDGTERISNLIASPPNRGTDDTKDSDGVAVYSADHSALQKTIILGIEMPEAAKLSVALYESRYHDSGFYNKGYELPQTGGFGTTMYTVGGLLIIGTGFLLLYKGKKRRKDDLASS